jgi:hypothetical protein
VIDRALEATAELWPPVRVAYGWVQQAAHILGDGSAGERAVRGRLGGGWA